jgi:hypothetical protein
MSRTIGHGRNPGYKSGSWWAECDSCGFEFRKEELKKDWQGRWMCEADYESRHPQELLRVQEEKIAADEPVRPPRTSTVVTTTFAETYTVPSGTFNDNNETL